MPARSLPLRVVRATAATLVIGVVLVVLVVGNLVVVGRAGEARCESTPGWTHAEGERIPPSLRCLGGAAENEVVLDDATAYVRWVFAVGVAISAAVLAASLWGVRHLLRLSGADLRAWWQDFP